MTSAGKKRPTTVPSRWPSIARVTQAWFERMTRIWEKTNSSVPTGRGSTTRQPTDGREVKRMIEIEGASVHPRSPRRCLRHRRAMYRLLRLPVRQTSATNAFLRTYTSRQTAPLPDAPSLTEGERYIFDKLTKELEPSELLVQDVSGRHSVFLLCCFVAYWRAL